MPWRKIPGSIGSAARVDVERHTKRPFLSIEIPANRAWCRTCQPRRPFTLSLLVGNQASAIEGTRAFLCRDECRSRRIEKRPHSIAKVSKRFAGLYALVNLDSELGYGFIQVPSRGRISGVAEEKSCTVDGFQNRRIVQVEGTRRLHGQREVLLSLSQQRLGISRLRLLTHAPFDYLRCHARQRPPIQDPRNLPPAA